MKILIVKRDKLGDLLLTTPMLAWLRRTLPEATIDVMANDYNAWVVAGNPDIDRLWIFPRVKHAGKVRIRAFFESLRISWRLRREHYDWVLIGNGEESPRAIKRGLAFKGKRTVAYTDAPGRYPGLSDPRPVPHDLHESLRLARLAEALGLQPPAILPAPRYDLPERDAAFAQDWLAQRGLRPGAYIVLGLGARRAKKQPTTAQILEWTERLWAEHGVQTVFMWTPGKSDNPLYPGDDEVAEPVLAARQPHIHPFRGPLNEALGLVWHARTSIFPDSGLMHFAAASPGGVLGLFADTSVSPPPTQWAPIGPRACWLEADEAVAQLPTESVMAMLRPLLRTNTD